MVALLGGFAVLAYHKLIWEAEAQQDAQYGQYGRDQERGVGQRGHIEQQTTGG